ncbi:sterol desaturase family protein [Oceanicella actignis]|uniref:Sterol desaturase/sphingolipid hydroxylase, fatty acid hydroxylase superfamily n=1 Tax=Oceanicella actignis TaxID=1189325 RepID=A0A1M7SNZ6_9RHOB|nr:sterol desaturase family protein [Oceanicella actignis]SES64863.1 Sterol desaturase/sphingolipid hydroxylase, fatty acid hydroxylase superfamily [Oceanicella actignis]SHN60144.1 Sterol desaturase/sphingolipid hydroxylase, fatty acid hydroxylase superfamily [Oceanicella actignis]
MSNEPLIRLAVFAAVFCLMAGWEALRPARALALGRWPRWGVNWAVAALDAALVRLLFPAAAAGAAWDAQAMGWGLFNALDWAPWLEALICIAALDFAIWFQHLLSHKIPILWRVHRVHHADRDVDVTTAIRFHPIEIALSMLFKIGLVYALGAPALAVILFEILLNGCAMFNHANISLPARIEAALRWLLVTPDMHRIHHSVRREETDSNYGFNLSWWDRLFGTYRARARGALRLGLPDWQTRDPARLGWTLLFPFLRR